MQIDIPTYAIGGLLFLLVSCGGNRLPSPVAGTLDVMMARENGQESFGDEVAVAGVLSTRFEDLHLYATGEAYREHDYHRCLNVTFDLDSGYYDKRKELDRKKVIVYGTMAPIDSTFLHTGGCGYVGIVISRIDFQ